MKAIDYTAGTLAIVGALNWGLVGLMRFDLVRAIFGDTILASIVYILVGIAGVVLLVQLLGTSRRGSFVRA